jgi:hypothetical protein
MCLIYMNWTKNYSVEQNNKKWINKNRDSSSVVSEKKINNYIQLNENKKNKENNVSRANYAELQALRKVRKFGYVVPSKVTHRFTRN